MAGSSRKRVAGAAVAVLGLVGGLVAMVLGVILVALGVLAGALDAGAALVTFGSCHGTGDAPLLEGFLLGLGGIVAFGQSLFYFGRRAEARKWDAPAKARC